MKKPTTWTYEDEEAYEAYARRYRRLGVKPKSDGVGREG